MKNFQYLALIMLMGAASQSFAMTGIVQFSGEISSETCTAEVGSAGTETAVVNLPKVALGSLSSVGTTAADTKFSIKIVASGGGDCDIENTVSGIYFEPNSQQINNDGRLNNTAADGAKDIELRLLNNIKQPINLTKNYGDQESSAISENVFNYYAQYYAASDAATAGKVVSEVNYTIVYK